MSARASALLLSLCAAAFLAPEVGTASVPLGARVVSFCRAHLGQRVGNGECAGLAFRAMKAAGAKTRAGPDSPGKGDYVWGRQVLLVEATPGGPRFTGAVADVQPGDIMQYRNVRFGRAQAHHHTAVVNRVDRAAGTIAAFAQNGGGRRYVFEVNVPLSKITQGWIRIYRPIPARPST